MSEPSLGLMSRLWLREPDSETLAAAREVPSLAPYAAEPAPLAAAYTDLFLLNVYPYGTVFTDLSGELNGPAAWETARLFEDRGFRPKELFETGAPDHLGLCLGFLEHLARAGETDVDFSSRLLEWAPICCLAVERAPSAHPFYKALAAVTRERLMEDGGFFMSSRAKRGIPGLSETADPEEEDIGLSWIVRFLLAPARSGLFLSRGKLGHLATAAGMRIPFGTRFDVARMLFQTAGESGKVGAVLDLLGEELAAWEAAYRAWAEGHRRWAAAASRWLRRTEETRRLLGQMREILKNPPELKYADGRSGERSP